MDIKELFKVLVEREASDLFLRTLARPHIRLLGKVQKISDDVISKEAMMSICDRLLESETRKRQFVEDQDIDFIHDEVGVGRFRINIFMQRGSLGLVARYVHSMIKTFDDLSLPNSLLTTFCKNTKGMFLACGPAGNGKSTMIASMINYINSISEKHIMTLEDPIEYLFKDDKCIINQREIGLDVADYPTALKYVTQQSPDIIYIGNVRDEETMRAAITATELGTFVMSTFHTVNCVQTIIRIINFFPPHMHDEIRMQLSIILKGIVSLRLLEKSDGSGRVPAFETMVMTPTISRLVREGKIREIQGYIEEGELFGMQSFKQSLVGLVQGGFVSEDEAGQYADSRDDFNLAIKGINKST